MCGRKTAKHVSKKFDTHREFPPVVPRTGLIGSTVWTGTSGRLAVHLSVLRVPGRWRRSSEQSRTSKTPPAGWAHLSVFAVVLACALLPAGFAVPSSWRRTGHLRTLRRQANGGFAPRRSATWESATLRPALPGCAIDVFDQRPRCRRPGPFPGLAAIYRVARLVLVRPGGSAGGCLSEQRVSHRVVRHCAVRAPGENPVFPDAAL